jgi:sarcinarray family protein
MIRTLSIISVMVFLFIVTIIPVHTASECEYGSVQAWFQASDGEWMNATAHPLLKRGEPFNIKINVTPVTTLQVFYLELHEFGTPVYEVVEGPTAVEQLLECWMPNQSNQSFMYLWKMKVSDDTTWVNGYAPLEVFAQFNKNDTNENRVNFDVITAFIVEELWENFTQENIRNNFSSQGKYGNKLPSINMADIVIVLFLLGIYLQARRRKHSNSNTSVAVNLLKLKQRKKN